MQNCHSSQILTKNSRLTFKQNSDSFSNSKMGDNFQRPLRPRPFNPNIVNSPPNRVQIVLHIATSIDASFIKLRSPDNQIYISILSTINNLDQCHPHQLDLLALDHLHR